MVEWQLKSWTHLFSKVKSGDKTHDIRDMTRDFKIGDFVRLKEFCPIRGEYTGDELVAEITYITSQKTPCALSSSVLQDGYCVLSLKLEE